MHDVFISYAHKNKKSADDVCNYLESGGIRCWYAPRDIRPSDMWAECLEKAIRESKVFVLIYSKHAARSNQVSKELALAREDSSARIVAFQVSRDSCARHPRPAAEHWLDTTSRAQRAVLDQLYQTICSYLSLPDQRLQRKKNVFSEICEWFKYDVWKYITTNALQASNQAQRTEFVGERRSV